MTTVNVIGRACAVGSLLGLTIGYCIGSLIFPVIGSLTVGVIGAGAGLAAGIVEAAALVTASSAGGSLAALTRTGAVVAAVLGFAGTVWFSPILAVPATLLSGKLGALVIAQVLDPPTGPRPPAGRFAGAGVLGGLVLGSARFGFSAWDGFAGLTEFLATYVVLGALGGLLVRAVVLELRPAPAVTSRPTDLITAG